MVCGVGVTGKKYLASINGKHTKEYEAWCDMLKRCFDENFKETNKTYKNVTCCSEWLLYENFYEWLHSQENFDKWYNNKLWCVEKDILTKGNKVYSPDTCCLVSNNINKLFIKRNDGREKLPIGVRKYGSKFRAICHNPFTNKQEQLDVCSTPEQAFQAYKFYKENLIKQIAQMEYSNGNITKQCYEAMMSYIVEIDD